MLIAFGKCISEYPRPSRKTKLALHSDKFLE